MPRDYECIVRLRVMRPQSEVRHAFGTGTAQLLRGVDELHSINLSAKRMGMAYSKAWKSLNATEQDLGFALLERDGRRGSRLTARGRRFLETYERAEQAALAAARAVLEGEEW